MALTLKVISEQLEWQARGFEQFYLRAFHLGLMDSSGISRALIPAFGYYHCCCGPRGVLRVVFTANRNGINPSVAFARPFSAQPHIVRIHDLEVWLAGARAIK